MSTLLDFLFGKDPDIFDEKGQVRHKFNDKKWQDWQKRFQDEEHNWREHSAKKPVKTTSANAKTKS